MHSADIISSFFNNELSPEQERQFLLSVASSDSLRLGLKSHVMLDKMLVEDTRTANPSTEVRRTILTKAALVAGTASIDPSTSVEAENVATENGAMQNGTSEVATSAKSGGLSGSSFASFTGWITVPVTLLVALASFFIGYRSGVDELAVAEQADDVVAAEIVPSYSVDDALRFVGSFRNLVATGVPRAIPADDAVTPVAESPQSVVVAASRTTEPIGTSVGDDSVDPAISSDATAEPDSTRGNVNIGTVTSPPATVTTSRKDDIEPQSDE